jgi:ATP-dependent Clp protease ATP-binding subunit ClpA
MMRDLTALAEVGGLPELARRPEILDPLTALLVAENHVLLVGKSGAGKTAAIESLAQAVAGRDCGIPEPLHGRPVWEYLVTAFQYESTYVNAFETRVHNIVRGCVRRRAILVIDRIEESLVAGICEGKEERSLANLLLPYLSGSGVVVAGTTTPEGYRRMLELNPAFASRFHVVDVPPMTAEQVARLVPCLEDSRLFRDTRIDPAAVGEAVKVGLRFFPWQALPGSAVGLLRAAAAMTAHGAPVRAATGSGQSGESTGPPSGQSACVTRGDVIRAVQRRFGLPDWLVMREISTDRAAVIAQMESEVFGQREAVEAVADALLRVKAELNDPRRPTASFLLLGPTGVGKTQLARTTARVLFGSEERMARYDMGEYATLEAVQGLTGRARYGRRSLVAEVMAQPFLVILFDEVEKAHPRLQALLLSLLGEGRLTDDLGRTATFTNCIIFLTSNLGAHLYGKTPLGFGVGDGGLVNRRTLMAQVEEAFLPEFLNRLTRVIHFSPLSRETVLRIAQRELDAVAARPGLQQYGLTLTARTVVLDMLAQRGFSKRYGAREMQRAVEDLVVRPLADAICAGRVPMGAEVTLDPTGDRISLRVKKRSSRPPAARTTLTREHLSGGSETGLGLREGCLDNAPRAGEQHLAHPRLAGVGMRAHGGPWTK